MIMASVMLSACCGSNGSCPSMQHASLRCESKQDWYYIHAAATDGASRAQGWQRVHVLVPFLPARLLCLCRPLGLRINSRDLLTVYCRGCTSCQLAPFPPLVHRPHPTPPQHTPFADTLGARDGVCVVHHQSEYSCVTTTTTTAPPPPPLLLLPQVPHAVCRPWPMCLWRTQHHCDVTCRQGPGVLPGCWAAHHWATLWRRD